MNDSFHYDPNIHHRRSIRLPGYDYSRSGAYFITICTHNRENLFGEIAVIHVGAGSKPALPPHPADAERTEIQPALPAQTEHAPGQTGCASIHARAGLEPAPTGKYVESQLRLNEYGQIVQKTWDDLIDHIDGIELGEFVVMPNHIHGIIIIDGAGRCPLSEIIRQLKTFSSRRINEKRGTPGAPVWQRNYFEHIIRNQESYEKIAAYIANNPAQWETDKLFCGEKP